MALTVREKDSLARGDADAFCLGVRVPVFVSVYPIRVGMTQVVRRRERRHDRDALDTFLSANLTS